MTDNSSNFNNLQERNQQTLNDITQLQSQEQTLYKNLEDVSLTTEQKQQIINKINEISQIRMNLYTNLKDMYAYYQQNVSASGNVLAQSMAAVDILENELNQSKIKMNLIEDEKYNKLRLVEINTYFGKRYNAHSKLMKTIILICIPIIILSVLANKGILPESIYKILSVIILIIGSILIGLQLIDLSNRDEMNWDEYNWYFNINDAPSSTSSSSSSTSSSNPWETTTATCVGSACCYSGSTYDTEQNMCVPTAVYNQYQTSSTSSSNTNSSNTNSSNTNSSSNISSSNTSSTETFEGLEKYGYSQIKAFSTNNVISPIFASLSKF